MKGGKMMNKKAQIAVIVSLIFAVAVAAVFVYAAPKKCNNGVDDDGDGLIDYPNDAWCDGKSDNSETSPSLACDNGLDESSDADLLADYRLVGGDAGCFSITDTNEISGDCDDLSDNDNDTFIDFSLDPECSNYSDVEYSCGDTDVGIVHSIQGIVSGSFGGSSFNAVDFCIMNSTILTEYYCNPYNLGSQNINCAVNGTG